MDRERMLDKYRRTYSKTAAQATEFGWTIEHQLEEQTEFARLELTLRRGGEIMSIWWEEGRLLEAPKYIFNGVETKLRNHSALIQQMAKTPDVNRSARKARRLKAGVDYGYTEILSLVPSLPWDPAELGDKELKAALYGRTLVWKNNISGMPDQDEIWYGYWDGRKQRYIDDPFSGPNWNASNFKITYSSTGRRIVNFVGRTGFRSVGVDSLLQVIGVGPSMEGR